MTTIELITDHEIAQLEATNNEREWNALCDKIKKDRGGQYPPDWWPKMMLSGKIAAIQDKWTKRD